MNKCLAIMILALALACQAMPAAGGELHSGEYNIRYNAFTANYLPDAVIDELGIAATRAQGVVNITVLTTHGELASTVPAKVSGTATTLTGQVVDIRFQRIRDAGGESWLGTFQVPGTGTIRFEVSVTPQGSDARHVSFTQDYYLD